MYCTVNIKLKFVQAMARTLESSQTEVKVFCFLLNLLVNALHFASKIEAAEHEYQIKSSRETENGKHRASKLPCVAGRVNNALIIHSYPA